MMTAAVICNHCKGPILCLDDAWVQWQIYRHEELYSLSLVHHEAARNSRRCTYEERGKDPVEVENHHGNVFVGHRSEHRNYLRNLAGPKYRFTFNKIMRELRALASREKSKALPTDRAFRSLH